jgi:DNA-binding CsgD family transcriptional regulator
MVVADSAVSDDAAWVDGLTKSYNAEFYLYDPSPQNVARWSAGRWYDDREWTSPSHRAHSVYHQEFLRPLGLDNWEGTFLNRTSNLSHFLSLMGESTRQDNDRAYRDQIGDIQVHLVRAIRMHTKLDELHRKVTQGEAALDALSSPVFLLDEQRRLLRANFAAQALMEREPTLRFVHGQFAATGYSESKQWQAALEHGVIVIPRKEPRTRPLVFSLIPVPANTRLATDRQQPMTLMLAQSVRSTSERRQHLCVIYGLTAAEAVVCTLLCDDAHSPQRCADIRQVSVETIRSQIKTIYIKTGVNRLNELVRLLNSL